MTPHSLTVLVMVCQHLRPQNFSCENGEMFLSQCFWLDVFWEVSGLSKENHPLTSRFNTSAYSSFFKTGCCLLFLPHNCPGHNFKIKLCMKKEGSQYWQMHQVSYLKKKEKSFLPLNSLIQDTLLDFQEVIFTVHHSPYNVLLACYTRPTAGSPICVVHPSSSLFSWS